MPLRPSRPLLSLTALLAIACTEHPTDRQFPAGTDTDVDPALLVDEDEDGWTPHEGDCDDTDPATFPAAAEDCTEVDRNCDGDPFGGVVWEIAAIVKNERDDSEPFKAVSWWYDPGVDVETREHDARLVETRWFLSHESGLPRWHEPIMVETHQTTADDHTISVQSITWQPSRTSPIQARAQTHLHDAATGWRVSTELRDEPTGRNVAILTTWTRNDDGVVTGETVHRNGLLQSELELMVEGDAATGSLAEWGFNGDGTAFAVETPVTRTYDAQGQMLSDHVEERTREKWAWDAPGELTSHRFGTYGEPELIDGEWVRPLTWHTCFEQTWEDGERLTRTTYDACEQEPELRQPLQTTTFVGSCVEPDDWQDVLYFWEEDRSGAAGAAGVEGRIFEVEAPPVGLLMPTSGVVGRAIRE